MSKQSLDTICIQGGWEPKNGEPRQLPIYQSTTFKYTTSEQMGRLLTWRRTVIFIPGWPTPPMTQWHQRSASWRAGVGAMLTSSGQAATFYAILNICQAGDHVISSSTIYGGSTNLFTVTFPKMGVECTLVNPDADEAELAKAFRPNTKVVFAESIANPALTVLDFEKFARLAHSHGVPLIVDNTFATPINCRPFEWGADIVTHSTTKYMDGHAATVGGCIVDSGNFDWEAHHDKFKGLTEPDESYHGIVYTQKFGRLAYIQKATAQLMRDLGSIQSPQNAFLINIGLETLHLRVPRHCESAFKVASLPSVQGRCGLGKISGTSRDKYYELAQKYMPKGTCGVISFGLKGGRQAASVFMDKLKLCSIETHVADSRTAVLHPASHTHRQLTDEQLVEAGVDPSMIRFSVGLESADDVIEDIRQALED